MNSFERIQTTPAEYRPILPIAQAERATDSQQSECCCPELCQLDHAN
jgi:hypothetical protein